MATLSERQSKWIEAQADATKCLEKLRVANEDFNNWLRRRLKKLKKKRKNQKLGNAALTALALTGARAKSHLKGNPSTAA